MAGLCLLVAKSCGLYALFNHPFGATAGTHLRLVPPGDCRSFDYRCCVYVLFRQMLVKRLTLEKNLAEKLRRETQEQSRLRSKFFTAANHDIRQPLQAIGIYIQLLKKKRRSENAGHC